MVVNDDGKRKMQRLPRTVSRASIVIAMVVLVLGTSSANAQDGVIPPLEGEAQPCDIASSVPSQACSGSLPSLPSLSGSIPEGVGDLDVDLFHNCDVVADYDYSFGPDLDLVLTTVPTEYFRAYGVMTCNANMLIVATEVGYATNAITIGLPVGYGAGWCSSCGSLTVPTEVATSLRMLPRCWAVAAFGQWNPGFATTGGEGLEFDTELACTG